MPETPWPQQHEFGLSGEQNSLKELLPCKEGDMTSSGEQYSIKDSLGEYDFRLYPCKEGDVTSSGEQGSLRNSQGEGAQPPNFEHMNVKMPNKTKTLHCK